jgi:hypothetical protein
MSDQIIVDITPAPVEPVIVNTGQSSVISVNGRYGVVTLTKEDVGLGNVINTSNYLPLSGGAVIGNIDTLGKLLSAGVDLATVFLPTSIYQNASGNWQNTFTNVQNNSASWENFTNTTFNQLTSLKANNQLIAGKYYRISDFHLMWWNQSINDTTVKMGLSAEPLIVLALSGNKISHEAKSEIYPQDTVYYDIDASGSYSWGTINNNIAIPNFKGWIYRRIDHRLNIDIPWDWRHITVNCCRPDMTSISLYNSATTYSLYSVVKNASNKLYYSIQNNNTNNSLTNTNWWLPVTNSVERNTYFVTDESFGFRAYNKDGTFVNLPADTGTRIQQPTFTSSLVSQGTFFLNGCYDIKIESGYSNVFWGNNIRENIIGYNFLYNTIGANFISNTIGNAFSFNMIGDNFFNNVTNGGFSLNITQLNFYSNTIGNSFNSNTIGNSFYSNTIGNSFNSNTIGDFFYYNTIGNYFNSNAIGNNFANNTIGNIFYSNIIGNFFNSNSVGNYFYFNAIGNNFANNTIGNIFYSNIIGNNFAVSTIANEFFLNTVGNNLTYNTIGNRFNQNTIGDYFLYNNIGDDFYSSIIGNNFSRNTSEGNLLIGNVTGATHVYNLYNKRLFKNSNGTVRLSYFNNNDQLVVTDPTA